MVRCLPVSRYLGEHFKVGVGYNFTDFSDDLTDLNYDSQGLLPEPDRRAIVFARHRPRGPADSFAMAQL